MRTHACSLPLVCRVVVVVIERRWRSVPSNMAKLAVLVLGTASVETRQRAP